MEVDAEAGLRSGARLMVNRPADAEPDRVELNRDDDMEELTGKMCVVSLSLSVCNRLRLVI